MVNGVVGVYETNNNTYKAVIDYGGKQYNLGNYKELNHAIEIRKEAEQMRRYDFDDWYNKLFSKTPYRKRTKQEKITQKENYIQDDLDSKTTEYNKSSIFDFINDKDTCVNYLDMISNRYGLSRKEYLVKLVREDMFTHPEIIEEIRGVVLG